MEIKLEEKDVKDLKKDPTKVTNCKKCNEPYSKSQISILFIAFYILGTSIYGNYKLIQTIINLF
jgi:hypothetical protein